MGDFLGVLLTVLLLAANAFFVGAEFALISARRDRLEALAEQGKRSAVTVIRAGREPVADAGRRAARHHVCSILLGRVGEPAVAHLLETPFDLLGMPDARAAHGVVRRRDHDRRGAARAARRDGAEEHRDRRARNRRRCCWCRRIWSWVRAGAARHRVLRLVRAHDRCARSASRPRPNSRTRFRRSSCPR